MNILHIASEVTPWSQTGGLAEVAAALPVAQRRAGDEVLVLSPFYRVVRDRARERGAALRDVGPTLTMELGTSHIPARLTTIDEPDAEGIVFLDIPGFYDRDGLYTDEHFHSHADNAKRFTALAKAAGPAARALWGTPADVMHAHDWQAGLAPLFECEALHRATTVFTIHNLAYQGVFPKHVMYELGLDWSAFNPDELEWFDQVSFLKGGIAFADAVTTVSESYAREITTPLAGCGLDGFLSHNARRLTGIANGIDTTAWDPRTDANIAARFDGDDLTGKRACRAAIADEFGVEVAADELLCCIVSRFTWQKGLDLVVALAPELAALGIRVLVLGTGERDLEQRFRELSADPLCPIHARVAFDAKLARRMFAGCDATIMPSRFEPCGLNQLYAMRYGTVPIVHAVGGLRDTVIDPGDAGLAQGGGTGFCFEVADVEGLRWALGRAVELFADRNGWTRLQRAAMARDVSWSRSAARYREVYRSAMAGW